MNNSDIPLLSATDLGSMIAAKTISPVEAVQAYLSRIKDINPKLNAYITVCEDEAMSQAKEAEDLINQGTNLGPLHGVPVAIKDQIHSKGILTSDASKIRSGFLPDEDATVLSNLKKSGAVLLGKLNMLQMTL